MLDLEKELRAGRERGRKLLIPYLMGGMTDDWTQSLAAVIAAGADAVEVGIPFSDPMMDGPVIQEAALRALTRGTVPDQVLDGIARAEAPVPIAVMTYYNLVFRAGHKRMARSLAEAGVSGAIIADLPIEEITPWATEADAAGVDTVLLVAPSTPPDRVARVSRAGARFRLRRCPHGGHGRARGPRVRRDEGRGAHPGLHRHARVRRRGCVDAGSGRRRCARWPTASWWGRRWSGACSRTRGPTGRPPSSGRSGTPSTRPAR